jgi:hypothetical protein
MTDLQAALATHDKGLLARYTGAGNETYEDFLRPRPLDYAYASSSVLSGVDAATASHSSNVLAKMVSERPPRVSSEQFRARQHKPPALPGQVTPYQVHRGGPLSLRRCSGTTSFDRPAAAASPPVSRCHLQCLDKNRCDIGKQISVKKDRIKGGTNAPLTPPAPVSAAAQMMLDGEDPSSFATAPASCLRKSRAGRLCQLSGAFLSVARGDTPIAVDVDRAPGGEAMHHVWWAFCPVAGVVGAAAENQRARAAAGCLAARWLDREAPAVVPSGEAATS